jgi:hypothetical protein
LVSSAAIASLRVAKPLVRIIPEGVYVFIRRFLSAVLISDPLQKKESGEIEVIIPCSAKDNVALQYCVSGALRNLQNVTRIVIVTPEANVGVLTAIFDAYPSVSVESEGQFLPESVQDCIKKDLPANVRGWAAQQAIKIWGSLSSNARATLVLDADTILLKSRTLFTNEGHQVLLATHEYHLPYVKHFTRNWPRVSPGAPCSFVAHHQVFSREIMIEMFPGGAKSLIEWLKSGDTQTTGAPFSEFESYGQYLYANRRFAAHLAKWGNSSLPIEILEGVPVTHSQEFLSSQFRNHFSISVHSYNS